MKIYTVTGEPFPNGMAATNRIKCYARAIKEGGLDCEVIIYKRTEVYGKPIQNKNGRGVYEGVAYQYMGGTTLRDKSLLIRQINDRIDLWRTYRYLKKNIKKGDVLFLYMGGSVQLMLRLMKIAHDKGAYCVRDLCELPYGTSAETSKTIRLRKVTTEKQFPKLDGIISISDALLNYARVYASPTCKHIKVPIMVDFHKYYLFDESSSVETPYIFHSGTLYEQKDGILGMIEAFGKAVSQSGLPVKFISTGNINNSPHKDEIKKLIAEYHIEDRVVFTGYLQENELKDYLSKACMVLINKYRTQQNQYCFSTKLGEYLAASKPVIITRVGEAMNWLTDKENAYIVEPEDTGALANAITHVLQNREEARMIGLAGQEVCRQSFDYRNWSTSLINFFQELER